MGFYPPATDLLLQEHRCRPLSGQVLMVGRQNTGMTAGDVDYLLEFFGIPKRDHVYEIDASTQHLRAAAGRGAHITDRSFFYAFADCQVIAIDVSDYEGAEIVHDLSTPISNELHQKFDFIFDGSTLDNVFDPVTILRNITEMLKPGGRALLINWANSMPSAYIMPSPDWFMDFFALNDFADAQTFVVESGRGFGRGWHFDPFVVLHGQRGYRPSQVEGEVLRVTICLVEKGPNTTSDRKPVQAHYRGDKNKEPYLVSAERFSNSPRSAYTFPHIGPITNRPNIGPTSADQGRYRFVATATYRNKSRCRHSTGSDSR